MRAIPAEHLVLVDPEYEICAGREARARAQSVDVERAVDAEDDLRRAELEDVPLQRARACSARRTPSRGRPCSGARRAGSSSAPPTASSGVSARTRR